VETTSSGHQKQFLDRRVTLNVAALFYTDIKDLQAGVDAGGCSSRLTVNVLPRARALEAELFRGVQPQLGLRSVGNLCGCEG